MVQPLKDEIADLQIASDKAAEEKRLIEAQIDDLQRSIARSIRTVLEWYFVPSWDAVYAGNPLGIFL